MATFLKDLATHRRNERLRSKVQLDLTELSTGLKPPNYPSPMASGPLRRVSRHVPRHPRPRGDGA